MLLHSFNSWDKLEMMEKRVQVHIYYINWTLDLTSWLTSFFVWHFMTDFEEDFEVRKNMIFCKKIVYKSCTDPWQDKNSFLNLPINDSQLSLHVSIILRSLEDFLCSQSITIWPQTKFNSHLDQIGLWDPSPSNLKFSTQDPTYFLQILYDSFLRLNFM